MGPRAPVFLGCRKKPERRRKTGERKRENEEREKEAYAHRSKESKEEDLSWRIRTHLMYNFNVL